MERHQPAANDPADPDAATIKVTALHKWQSMDAQSDGDTEEGSGQLSRSDGARKQNHSEIEKRRRDKMNTCIGELSSLVPVCSAMAPRKVDKLTVLRLAVQHIRSLTGSLQASSENSHKPSFLTNDEIKHLILEAADGFSMVIGCDRGRILYASQSVSQHLHYSQGELLGFSCFDLVHPEDVAKVKEQLAASHLAPKEKLIDAKTLLPVKSEMAAACAPSRLSPGARRSFFCRIKVKPSSDGASACNGGEAKEEETPQRHSAAANCYVLVHCTGYLKTWDAAGAGGSEGPGAGEGEIGAGGLSCCLVAVGRVLPTQRPDPPLYQSYQHPLNFWSRHTEDGKFVFVDQRATVVLGFLPQELLGTCCYEYAHQMDVNRLADCVTSALRSPGRSLSSGPYRFRTRAGPYATLSTTWRAFRNPFTGDIEFLTADNQLENSEALLVDGSCSTSVGGGYHQAAQSSYRTPQLHHSFCLSPESCLSRSSGTRGSATYRATEQANNSTLSPRKPGDDSASSASPGTDQNLTTDESNSMTSSRPLTQVRCRPLTASSFHDNARSAASLDPTTNQRRAVGSEPGGGMGRHQQQLTAVTDGAAPRPGQSNEAEVGAHLIEEEDLLLAEALSSTSGQSSAGSTEANDEAAMAVIMSLLEADAGLGGPVDFSGLPWPLP